jgi:dTDP-4-dehydrorhamnose 3,5-epimerase
MAALIFTPTGLDGAYLIEPRRREDERGFFARTFTVADFQAHGLRTDIDQAALSYNHRRGTLRGLHFQRAPHAQAKLVRCTQGAIHDVIVDLRAGSPTRTRWFACELSAVSRRLLYVPEGFAHGFLTLSDEAEVSYQIAGAWRPESEHGARFDDPAFGITWPSAPSVLSERDRTFPDWNGEV